jgi:hypothetical protein
VYDSVAPLIVGLYGVRVNRSTIPDEINRVPEKIRFKKQYKPIGFGDGPNRDTVEGQRNAQAEAAETRRYNQAMKELEAEKASRRGLLARVLGFSGWDRFTLLTSA